MRTLLKNNWVVTVIGGVLSVLVLRLMDSFFMDDFLWDGINNGINAVAGFFNKEYLVKLYFLILLPILGIASLIGILYLISLFKPKANKGPRFGNPDWDVYRRDVFDGIYYLWGYSLNRGSTKITNIWHTAINAPVLWWIKYARTVKRIIIPTCLVPQR